MKKAPRHVFELLIAVITLNSLFLFLPLSLSCQVLSHQELRESLAKENAPLMTARATYDFQPQSDRELQFKKVASLQFLLYSTVYKWKNHFYEMKGDVGMSVHKKRKETRRCLHQDTNSFITPSLHLCSEFCLFVVNALGKEKRSSH